MKRAMLVSVFVFTMSGIASAVSWIEGEDCSGSWHITPGTPTPSDMIAFSGPLSSTFINSWLAESEAGGSPTITIDHFNKTVELWFEPPPPDFLPYLYDPVCGLEGSLGPLQEGEWEFSGGNSIASFSISFTVVSVPGSTGSGLGDVTGNGTVSSYDASLVAQYVTGLVEFTPEQIEAADVNGDGEVTHEDAELIADYAIGFIDEFPCYAQVRTPTVLTRPETNVTSTSAALWGMVQDDGGELCQYRFRYRIEGGNLQYTAWTGSVATGQWFRQDISGLTPDSKYYFSVQAENSEGNTAWALAKSFRTLPDDADDKPEVEVIFSDNFNDGMLHPTWQVGQSDWIEESNGELRFHGTTVHSGWGVGGWGARVGSFPEGDFEVSADFRIPQFDGPGTRLIYLQARSWDQTVGIFYSYGFGYRVQTWNPRGFSEWLYPFGNERTTFHRMKLTYDAATETVAGYVDDIFVGSLSAPMDGDLAFTIGPATETQGMVIDARYDDFYARVVPTSKRDDSGSYDVKQGFTWAD